MRYRIFVLYQEGNIGPHCIVAIKEQPSEGFPTEKDAEAHLKQLFEKREGYFFDRPWYEFIISKSWSNKF